MITTAALYKIWDAEALAADDLEGDPSDELIALGRLSMIEDLVRQSEANEL